MTGQRVRTLSDEDKKMGSYEVVWDGRDNGGRRVSSGVYLVRLQAGSEIATAKMVVVRCPLSNLSPLPDRSGFAYHLL
ncbi:MAG: FlgD immunoglobulin-like domain containing protein [Thermodesulfobacteriota bacterium]|nr:FlgD immunoglobulin-like domain containing protein [Thermodesulfobacteriota bacterium]